MNSERKLNYVDVVYQIAQQIIMIVFNHRFFRFINKNFRLLKKNGC